MYVLAESDLLSPFLGLTMYLKIYYPELYYTVNNFLKTSLNIPDTKIALYKDPYSLPSIRPPLPQAILRMKILPVLKRIVKNPEVKELIEASESKESKDCILALDTATCINARVFANIYAA